MAVVLIIDDGDRHIDLCRREIPEHEYIGPARDWRSAKRLLDSRRQSGLPLDLILLDVHFDIPAEGLLGVGPDAHSMSDTDLERARRTQGFRILEALQTAGYACPVIVMTCEDDVPIDVDARRLQARDYTYLLEDDYLDARTLRVQMGKALADFATGDESYYWGDGAAVAGLRRRVAILARGQLPILLLGPTGTGKSMLAREYIHARSGRAGPFVAVDLSSIPRDLVAGHLFGVVKGAYTGATQSRDGVLAQARGGTLFLDEIGNLDVELQKSLLQVLQDRRFTRLGDTREIELDVKLVAATNENLVERVRGGDFREDLYMRLNPSTAVVLPSLRERSPDILGAIRHFIGRVAREAYNHELLQRYGEQSGLELTASQGARCVRVAVGPELPPSGSAEITLLLHPSSLQELRNYPWPGNFRQLEMVLSNALTMTLVELIELPESRRGPAGTSDAERADLIPIPAKTIADLLRYPGHASPSKDAASADEEDSQASLRIDVVPAESLKAFARGVEQQVMMALFRRHDGDLDAVARDILVKQDAEGARRVQLRLNKLGISVRALRADHD